MSKILSIEVGNSLTKIVEMDYKSKAPKVYKYLSLPTPDAVFDDGYISDSAEFSLVIKKALMDNKIKTKQAICSITCSKIANREVLLPAMKTSQVESTVKANASEYFPVDLSQYEIGHLILDTVKDENNLPKLKVMVLACEKELIAGYDKLCEDAGLHLISIDYAGNSVFQIMKKELTEETEMIIKVEEQATVATIIKGQNLMMQRNLGYGIDNLVQTMMGSSAFAQNTYTDCLKELQRVTCIKLSLSDAEDAFEKDQENLSEKTKKAMSDMTEALGPLIGNVGRVLDLYNSKNSESPITKVSLIGLGSEISGLSKLFSRELGVKTVSVETVKSINWVQTMGTGNSGEYVTAMGATYSPIGFVNEEKKKNDLKSVNYKNLTALCAVLTIVVIAALCVFSIMPYNEEYKKNANLKNMETMYLPAVTVKEQYEKTQVFYEKVKEGYGLSDSNNDNLLAFLTELEAKLPADAVVREFTSDNSQASMTIRAASMEEAAKIIQTVRGFECVQDVEIGPVNQEEEEAVEKANEEILDAVKEGDIESLVNMDTYFVFNLICKYFPNGATKEGGR